MILYLDFETSPIHFIVSLYYSLTFYPFVLIDDTMLANASTLHSTVNQLPQTSFQACSI